MNELLLRRRVASAKPYDAEIEYLCLRSDPVYIPYINTGIKGSNNVRFNINVEFPDNGDIRSGFLIGSRISNKNKDISLFFKEQNTTDDGIRWTFGKSQVTKKIYPSFDVTHNFNNLNTARVLTFDTTNTFTANNNTFSNNLDMYLFGVNNNGSVDRIYFSVKLFALSIYNGSTLVRDYIPVRVGTTGYLYDKVSGQLFGNAGTGSFVLGPDK